MTTARGVHWFLIMVRATTSALSILIALLSSAVSANPPSCVHTDGSGKAGEVVLHFPKDFSCGRIFKMIRTSKGVIDFDKHSGIEARGDVHVPSNSQLRLKLSYAAVENPSVLLSVAPEQICGLDARSLDNLTDDALKYFAHFTNTVLVSLDETDVSSKGLQYLTVMKNLEELSMNRTLLDGTGLSILKSFPQMRTLCLTNNKFQKASLAKLSTLKNLRELDCQSDGLIDAGLDGLSGFDSLQKINLCHNLDLTDKCLPNFRKVPSLKRLEVADTKITAKGIAQLKIMKLQHVMLDINRQSAKDMDALREAMPDCKFTAESGSRMPTEIFEPLK
jgi:hypothetical protein